MPDNKELKQPLINTDPHTPNPGQSPPNPTPPEPPQQDQKRPGFSLRASCFPARAEKPAKSS